MAYAKCKVFDLKDNTNYELGMDFDYGKLLISNYIDLNVFAHKTFLIDQSGKFDRSLTRFIDWDFVLRYTRRSAPFFLDKVMCNYHILPKTNSITINNDYAHNYSLIRSRHNRFLLDGR